MNDSERPKQRHFGEIVIAPILAYFAALTSRDTLLLKLRYLAELCLALLFIYLIAWTTSDMAAAIVAGAAALFIVGERHMRLMKRPPWLGVLAFAGIGALILLLLPPSE